MDNLSELTPEQQSLISKIKSYSIFVMSKYPKSKKGMKDKILKSKNYETYLNMFDNDDYIDKIIDYLEEINIINDYELTLGRVRSRFISGWGFNKIIGNVPKTLSVDIDLVKRCIDEMVSEHEENSDDSSMSIESESILNYLKLRVKKDDLADYKNKNKVIRRLISRGFNYSEVNKMIDAYTSV